MSVFSAKVDFVINFDEVYNIEQLPGNKVNLRIRAPNQGNVPYFVFVDLVTGDILDENIIMGVLSRAELIAIRLHIQRWREVRGLAGGKKSPKKSRRY